MDIAKHNQAAWDGYVDKKDKWTRPVTEEDLENAEKGRWSILGEALEFGHSLTDQVGGQMEAGLVLTDMHEDRWNDGKVIDDFLPAFIATRAVKPANI